MPIHFARPSSPRPETSARSALRISGVISKASSAPASSMLPCSSGCRFTKLSMSAACAGWPMKSATSKVKKSHGARKRSTVCGRNVVGVAEIGQLPSQRLHRRIGSLPHARRLGANDSCARGSTCSTPAPLPRRGRAPSRMPAIAPWPGAQTGHPCPTEYLFSFNP